MHSLKRKRDVHVCVVCVCVPSQCVRYFLLSCYVGEYNLEFSWKHIQSPTSKNCKDIELHWDLLDGKDFIYIISVTSFEDDENITSYWNYTTQNDSIVIPHDQLMVGVTYEAELQVVVENADSSLPDDEVITTQLLNITMPACSKPNG